MTIATNSTPASEIRTTRRRAIGLAAGAGIVAATAPATAMEGEPLEALWRAYQAANYRFRQAIEVERGALQKARLNYPPRPANLYAKNAFTGELLALDEEQITSWRDQSLSLGFRSAATAHDKQLEALRTWEAQLDAVDCTHGIEVLANRVDALAAEVDALQYAIIDARPQTLRGVRIKVMLLDRLCPSDPSDQAAARCIGALIADLDVAPGGLA